MSGATPDRPRPTWRSEIERDARILDDQCRRHFGVTLSMFRTAKYLYYIATLCFTGYLIEVASVEPFIAMTFAALLISGPEGLEAWMVRKGHIQERSTENSQASE